MLLGYLLIAIGITVLFSKRRSLLLAIAAISFWFCAASTALSIAMPVRFMLHSATNEMTNAKWPAPWVTWVTSDGFAIAILVAGTSLLAFAVRGSNKPGA